MIVRDIARPIGTQLRHAVRNPFGCRADRRLIVHCSHHKTGTVWLFEVLRAVGRVYGLSVVDLVADPIPSAADVALFGRASTFSIDHVGGRPFRGTHMIRDPRDVVVSGYFYHLRTREEWALWSRPRYGGKSYQEHLNGLSKTEGLLAEIDGAGADTIRDMMSWDYSRPDFLELRYEELLADEPAGFTAIFQSYGFTEEATRTGVRIAMEHSINNRIGQRALWDGARSHMRSGAPGQWRRHFEDVHVQRFKEVAGDALVRLGYERDDDW